MPGTPTTAENPVGPGFAGTLVGPFLGPVINLQAGPFNAKGDGLADDTVAVQKWINQLGSGTGLANPRLHAPKGTYLITATISAPQSASQFILSGDGIQATRFVWGGPAGVPMFEFPNPRWAQFYDFAVINNSANLPSHGIRIHRLAGAITTGTPGFSPGVTGCVFNNVFIGGFVASPTWSMTNGLTFQNDGGLLNNDESQLINCFITNCAQYCLWFNGLDSRQHTILGGSYGDAGVACISNVATGGAEGGSYVCIGANVIAGALGDPAACFELGPCENPIIVIGTKSEGPSDQFINTPNQITTKQQNYQFIGCYYSGYDGTVINFNATLGELHLVGCQFTTVTVANYTFAGAGSTVIFDECDLNASTITYNNALSLLNCIGRTASTTFTNSGSGYLRVRDCHGNLTKYNTAGNDGDRGDASITLTAGIDREVQTFNTPLTAPRTITLSATNARTGDRFRIVRMTGATGTATLTVSNVTLAVGDWTEWIYSSTFGGWQKTASGNLIPRQFSATTEGTLVAGLDVTGLTAVSVTLTAARLIAAFTNAVLGQRMTLTFIQDGTGGRAVTWNAVFKTSWSDTGNTLNKRSSIAYIYDGINWNQDGAQTPYV